MDAPNHRTSLEIARFRVLRDNIDDALRNMERALARVDEALEEYEKGRSTGLRPSLHPNVGDGELGVLPDLGR